MDLNRYLERIACTARPPSLEALCELQEKHVQHVPFETLSLHLDEPIDLHLPALLDKIVVNRRGGFCYELNSAFGWLLEQLGYDVRLLMTQPLKGDGTLAPPFAHLALKVVLDGKPYLVDVGFADGSVHPFPLQEGHFQHGFQLSRKGGHWTYASLDPAKTLYEFTTEEHPIAAFEEMCRFYATSAESGFRKKLYCGFQQSEGKNFLTENKWVHRSPAGETEQELDLPGFRRVLLEHYGVPLTPQQVEHLYQHCLKRRSAGTLQS